jgi:hypothetical protein
MFCVDKLPMRNRWFTVSGVLYKTSTMYNWPCMKKLYRYIQKLCFQRDLNYLFQKDRNSRIFIKTIHRFSPIKRVLTIINIGELQYIPYASILRRFLHDAFLISRQQVVNGRQRFPKHFVFGFCWNLV